MDSKSTDYVGSRTKPSDPRPSDLGPSPNSFASLGESLKEAQAFAGHYVAAQLDRAKLIARNLIVLSIVGVLALVAGASMIVTAAVQILTGLAGGLGELFGNRVWLGNIVVGVLFFVLVAVGAYIGVTRVTKTSKAAVVKSYEQRKTKQRTEFGADVHERAQQQRAGL